MPEVEILWVLRLWARLYLVQTHTVLRVGWDVPLARDTVVAVQGTSTSTALHKICVPPLPDAQPHHA